jgi:hypothetical protein
MRPSLSYRARLSLLSCLEEGRQVVQRLLGPLYSIARAGRHIVFDMNNVFKTPASQTRDGLSRSGIPK